MAQSKVRQCTLWAGNHRLGAAVLAILWGLALVSVAQGFRYAARFSTDFQWSPAVLLSAGVNPYQVALSGNPDGKILLSQYPPYLHLLYILMLPLAYLSYTPAKIAWAIFNFGFASASLVMLTRLFRLSTVQGLCLAALFFFATPYRNAIGNGQTSLLCLFAILIAWIQQESNEVGAGATVSVLLTKYSFAPPFLLWFLLEGKLKLLFTSVVCLVAGWLAFSWICNESPLTTLGQPVKVANMYSESEGGGDIMTLLQSFGLDRPVVGALRLSALAGISTSCLWIAVVRLRAARLSELDNLVCLCLVSLLSIRHLAYDFVFLAPAVALTFSLPRLSQVLAFVPLAYLWFGVKLLDSVNINGKWVELLSFLALNLMLLIVLSPGRVPSTPMASARGY